MGKYSTFQYFLECYFNVSANYNELEKLITEFKESELKKYHILLINELEEMQRMENIDNIKEFVRIHGMRNMKYDKLEWLIQTILCGLKTK